MPPVVWAVVLLAVAIGIVALEMFIPSGGLLGVMAAVAMISSIVVIFKYYGVAAGSLYLLFNALLAPIVIVLALKWWPHTPIGRKMLNLAPGDNDHITSTPTYDEYKELLGKHGVAETKMLPSGIVKIDGQRFDAVGQGVAIDPGQNVEVVAVEGNRIIVRPTLAAQGADQPDQPPRPGQQIVPDPFQD